MPIRYVRNYCGGSTVNSSAVWTELKVFRQGTNIAFGIIPTSNVAVTGTKSWVTDNDISNSNNYVSYPSGTRYIQIDLGQVYTDLDSIIVWHWHFDGRTFQDVITQVSEDGTNWITLFNSEIDGRYAEVAEGKTSIIPSVGLLPEKTVRDKAMELTSIEYETSMLYPENYGKTAGNFDGQGLSHGCIQYPLGWGTLQGIWKDLHTNYLSMVQSKFTVPADFTTWVDWLYNKTIQQQIDYADLNWTDWKYDAQQVRIPESGHNVKEPWNTYFRNLGITPESQLRQQQEADSIYHPNALTWFKDFGLWTRRGYALLFDISVQNGSINPLDANDQPIDVMGRIFTRFAGLDTTGLTAEEIETEKMKLIVEERAKEVNITWRPSYIERKNSIALGELYLVSWGKTVSTVPYDMILEQAFEWRNKTDLYVATSGDSFASIGQQYNTTGAIIQELNPQVVDTNIYTGLSFNVPYQEVGTNTGVFLGAASVNKIFIGETAIDKVFAGSALVYSAYVAPVEPVTTISPSTVAQNTIPFMVTLSNDQALPIYYKLGATGVQQTYSAPFSVSQDTAGVYDSQILVTYWSTGETEKTITYDTTGAIAGKTVVTPVAGNWYVRVNWTPTINTTSYNVYRSTVSGTQGDLLIEYLPEVGYDDGAVDNDVTYYYTVRSGNYTNGQLSDQVPATPTAGVATPSWRYVRYSGYGDNTGAVSRLVEIQALEGATNRLLNKPPMAGYTPVNGGAIAVATDGAKVQATGYPLWWGTEPTGIVTWDLGALYPIDTINVTAFSPAVDPRQPQFIIDVSKDNSAWTNVIDYTANTTVSPETGFNFPVPS